QERVFLSPDGIDKLLESIARGPGLGDLRSDELGGNLQPPRANDDLPDVSADEVPERHVAPRIDDRHVVQSVELVAEAGDDERDGADARPEQTAVRRILLLAFLLAESRALEKGEDRHRDVAITLAGAAG